MLRKFAITFTAFLAVIFLVSAAVTGALNQVFGTSGQLKQALHQSGLYQELPGVIFDSSVKAAQEDANIPAEHFNIEEAAAKALPPEFLQSSAEEIIDGLYRWLEGRADQPDFLIVVSDNKQIFADELGKQAKLRAESLPACTFQQLRQLQMQGYNLQNLSLEEALSLECLPPGVSPSEIEQNAVGLVLSSEAFLPDPVISMESLQKDGQVLPAFEQISEVPIIFQNARRAPWVLAVISLVLLAALAALHANRMRALLSTGIAFLTAGLILVTIQFFIRNVAATPEATFLQGEYPTLEPVIRNIVRSLGSAYASPLFTYGLIFAVMGTAAVIGYHGITRRLNQ